MLNGINIKGLIELNTSTIGLFIIELFNTDLLYLIANTAIGVSKKIKTINGPRILLTLYFIINIGDL